MNVGRSVIVAWGTPLALVAALFVSTASGVAMDPEEEAVRVASEAPEFAGAGGSSLLDTPFPAGWGPGCIDCVNCGDNGNKALGGDETSWYEVGAGLHDQCIESGTCLIQHPPTCTVTEEEQQELLVVMEDLRGFLVAADWGGVRDLLVQRPEWVQYHASRGAIQALGCNDQVLMHVPVPAQMLAP